MTISVVIPLYNKAGYIGRALKSVLAQTHRDLEVLVVDDGSTDGGTDIVREIGDPRVRLIVQENAGPGIARNRGLWEVQTELVAFLDADDEWLPAFLEENLRFFERYSSEASIVCADSVIHETGRLLLPPPQRAGLREGIMRLTPDMPKEHAMALLLYLQWWKTLSRADCLRKWGGYFDRERSLLGEDMWLSFKVVLNEPIAVNLKVLHVYHAEASELASHVVRRKHPRPIPPYLLYPEELEALCPEPLHEHLRYMLAPFAIGGVNSLAWRREFKRGRDMLKRFDCFSLVPWSDYFWAWLRTSRTLSVPLDLVRAIRHWRGGDNL